jgi:exonuclease SbcC
MLINRIELQNTKSYRDQTITFGPGTNAICGENGAGKSTLLEAIGFCLFDYLPNTQANFVREGERTATITVHFVSSADEREYQVVRKCGGSAEYAVYDPELKGRITAGKVDTLDWLREHMRVDSTTDVAALFRDAIGVPQGLLTAVFLQTPAQRKPTFDRLLRVDEYERVFKDLRETVQHICNEIQGTKIRTASLLSRLERLPGLLAHAESLQAEMSESEARLKELGMVLEQAAARRQALEAAKHELDELAQKRNQHEIRLQSIGDHLVRAQQDVVQAQNARLALEASRAGYDAYQGAWKALDQLEVERGQRDRLRDQQAGHERQRDLTSAELQRLEAELQETEHAAAQMATVAPQVARQEQLEHALQAARERLHTLGVVQVHVRGYASSLQETQSRLAMVEKGLAKAAGLESERSEVQAFLQQMRDVTVSVTSEQAALRSEAERLKKQTAELEAAESAACPVCEQPLPPRHRVELLERNRSQLDGLREHHKALAQQASEAAKREKELTTRSAGLEAQLRRLPRPAERDDLIARVGELQSTLAAAQTQLAGLADSQEQATTTERELLNLGDPRREQDRLAVRAGSRQAVEKQMATQQQTLTNAGAALAALERSLGRYAGLDERLQTQRSLLAQHESDHQQYLRSSQMAADLPTRTRHLNDLHEQQAVLTKEMDAVRSRYEEIAGRFDAQELAAAAQREDMAKTELAGLRGQHSIQQQRMDEVEREVEALAADQDALLREQALHEEQESLRGIVEFLRDVIRKAGPHVVRRVVQRVSLRASHLFGAIMADHTARLLWEEDYRIVLETGGRQRDFEQMSGGEQMAAALAVRLGLLRELSAIDVAFFDEPTSNLDETRRDNLAEQILAVKDTGFSQLFVISHDDTFEQVTDHVVRVRKEHGESRVVVG